MHEVNLDIYDVIKVIHLKLVREQNSFLPAIEVKRMEKMTVDELLTEQKITHEYVRSWLFMY